jgi:hypothetical protein
MKRSGILTTRRYVTACLYIAGVHEIIYIQQILLNISINLCSLRLSKKYIVLTKWESKKLLDDWIESEW